MAKKKEFNFIKTDAIAPSSFDVVESNVVPNGVMATLVNFGASISSDLSSPLVAVEWGDSSGGWKTIRALSSTWEFVLRQTFIGDGVKKFRLVRRHESSGNQRLIAWADIFIDQFE